MRDVRRLTREVDVNDWFTMVRAEQHGSELMATAKVERDVRSIGRARESAIGRMWRAAVVYTGRRLEAWGCRLQSRYDAQTEPTQA
jgi:hypothetical protein